MSGSNYSAPLVPPGQNGKRAQCNVGAKNHAIVSRSNFRGSGRQGDRATASSLQVLPDADPESVVNQLVGASCGAAGGPKLC